MVTLAHEALLVGFMLPPFASTRALPPSPRAWLPAASRQRPHMSPCRAACLVQLCCLRPGERFLDPCGGLGIIAIEAALCCLGLAAAVTIDVDPEATALVEHHADLAGLAGVVRAVCGDALALDGAGDDYDCVCVDLPYGSQHPRLNVAKLLKSVAGVLRPGGRALFVDSAQDGDAVRRSVASQAKVWALVVERLFDMAGIEAVAFELRRVEATYVYLVRLGVRRPRDAGAGRSRPAPFHAAGLIARGLHIRGTASSKRNAKGDDGAEQKFARALGRQE